jgi:hypothetical protein
LLAEEPAEQSPLLLGTCVEGIRVENNTPGFEGRTIVAIANARGPNAPKTNVARSVFEDTPERKDMLRKVYHAYCKHIEREIAALHQSRDMSLTWAVQEAKYLVHPLFITQGRSRASDFEALLAGAERLPLFLVERGGRRESISPYELRKQPVFWTTDSGFYRSAEMLIREVSAGASLSALTAALGATGFTFPDAPVICGYQPSTVIYEQAFLGKEVNEICLYGAQRRVDFRWGARPDSRWYHLSEEESQRLRRDVGMVDAYAPYYRDREMEFPNMFLGRSAIPISGVADEIGVKAFGGIFVFAGSELSDVLIPLSERLRSENTIQARILHVLAWHIAGRILRLRLRSEVSISPDFVNDEYQRMAGPRSLGVRDRLAELGPITSIKHWKIFDPSAWVRSTGVSQAEW